MRGVTTMSDCRRGYSAAFAKLVRSSQLDPTVAAFADLCIRKDVSVTDVAKQFGVTRATTYNWFRGVFMPRERHLARMRELVEASKVD